jgi:uncharacterized protein YbcI
VSTKEIMNKPGELAREIAEVAAVFERQRTGHAPDSISVMLGGGTLVIAVHGALSPAERAILDSPEGAASVEELQRQLFQTGGDAMRSEIQRITGSPIRVATVDIDRGSGTAIKAFPGGTLIQVYLLESDLPVQHWSGAEPASLPSEQTAP